MLQEVVVLDLAEIPVVIIQDLLKIIGVSVIGKTDIPDGSALFFLFDPVQDADHFQLFPHGQVGQVMHQIVIDVVGSEARQLFIEIFVQAFAVFDHILGKLCRDPDFFPDMIFFEDFPDGGFAPGINVGGVIVIDACPVGGHDFFFRLFQIYTVSFSGKTHAAEAQHGQLVSIAIFSVEHPDPPLYHTLINFADRHISSACIFNDIFLRLFCK